MGRSIYPSIFVLTALAFCFASTATAIELNLFAIGENWKAADIDSAIRAGADVNAQGEGGWTPLMCAAENTSNTEVIAALISAGADVNAKDEDGWTPLICAAEHTNNAEVITALISAGADVNAKDEDGWTPLRLVARYGDNPEVITALISAGADVNVNGWTPLHEAANNKNPEIITTLISAGADVNAKSRAGTTPLIQAADHANNAEVIAALISAGADVNAKNDNGRTPLIQAAREENNAEVIAALISAGADANAKDVDGWTPLIFAARYSDNPKIIAALIEAGADVNAKNKNGWTAFDLAESNESERKSEIAALLREALYGEPDTAKDETLYSVTVKVRDADGNLIRRAAVVTDSPKQEYFTGDDGTLEMKLGIGKHKIRVSAEGYDERDVTLDIMRGGSSVIVVMGKR